MWPFEAVAGSWPALHAGHRGDPTPLFVLWGLLVVLMAAAIVRETVWDDGDPTLADLDGYSVLLNERGGGSEELDQATALVAAIEEAGEFDRRLDPAANALTVLDDGRPVVRVRLEDGELIAEYRADDGAVSDVLGSSGGGEYDRLTFERIGDGE